MSTHISVGISLPVIRLTAHGIHAFGGLCSALGVGVLAKKTQDYFFPNANRNLSKYVAPGMGFLAGIATSMWISSSPIMAQELAKHSLISILTCPQMGIFIDKSPLQLFLNIVGPQFSSLSSVFCGVGGTVLGCWAFHKLS